MGGGSRLGVTWGMDETTTSSFLNSDFSGKETQKILFIETVPSMEMGLDEFEGST